MLPTEQCPRCSSTDNVERKLLLLNQGTLTQANSRFRPLGSSGNGFTVQGLKPEFLPLVSSMQFIHGLYCAACGIGFIPESIAKPEPPSYKLFREGWRRVLPNGELGPLLNCISDNPDSNES